MKTIKISAGAVAVQGQLNEEPTAQAIWVALPIEGQANRWGQEIYFSIPVTAEAESDARADVEVGELGYWPPGNAFCIFFGPTPASTDDKPRAASPVNILGRIVGDATVLATVPDGATVMIEQAEDI